MSQGFARFALLGALAAAMAGCDVLEFVEITEPGPPAPPGPSGEARGLVRIQYLLEESLRGSVIVNLASWDPSGPALEVRLDGDPVPLLSAHDQAVQFGMQWTVPASELGSLPQVLTIPREDEILRIPLPALVRETSGRVVCVGPDDPVLDYATVGDSTSWMGWHLSVSGEGGGFLMHGPDVPPDPIRLPQELLAGSSTAWTARLSVSQRRSVTQGDASLARTAQAMVEWTLIPAGGGSPECSDDAGKPTAGAE